MWKLVDWILGTSQEVVKKEEKTVLERYSPTLSVNIAQGLELVDEVPEEKFVDPETGKEYKTARSLKAAQTRRKNAAKKGTKTSKKKSKKSKK